MARTVTSESLYTGCAAVRAIRGFMRLCRPSGHNRRVLLAFCLWIVAWSASVSAAYGGDWNMHWIHHPAALAGDQVWFRRTFTAEGRPAWAHIDIASDGVFVLYVNGYNVSVDVPVPYGGVEAGGVRLISYDVSRFLRPDTNVVAVWYSPCAGGLEPGKATGKQLSVVFYGGGRLGCDGEPDSEYAEDAFSYATDETWLCATNGCKIAPDGGEIVDGRALENAWNGRDYSILYWQRAAATNPLTRSPIVETRLPYAAPRVTHIYSYGMTDADDDGLVYPAPCAFRGQVRVTLRGMCRGDTLSVGGLRYICSGATDEQACRRFTEADCGQVRISCSGPLSSDNIMSVEGIAIGFGFHGSWKY